jgi:hypothetical protein
LEKEKGFSILFWLWAKTQLEAEPGPASRFPFPTPAWPILPGLPQQRAQSASLPLSRSQPSAAQRPAEATLVSFLTETRPRRAHPAPPAVSRRTDLMPRLARLCLVPRPWLPQTLSPHACPEPTWMEFAGSLPTEANENQILTDYLPILSPNPEFSCRLGSGCCYAPARAFAPINRSVRRPPEHFSPLLLSFPIHPTGVVPTRSLPRQAKHRRWLPEPLRSHRRDNRSRRTPGASPAPSPVLEQRPRGRELSSRPPVPRKSFGKDLCHPRSVFSHPTPRTLHRGSSQRASENAGHGAAVRELAQRRRLIGLTSAV